MKIFNVHLHVTISQIGVIPDNPETPEPPAKEKFSDDPLDKQSKILNNYMDRLEKINAPRPAIAYSLGGGGTGDDGSSMTKNIRIQAETFEELVEILQKFNAVTKELTPVPDSLLASAVPTPSFG